MPDPVSAAPPSVTVLDGIGVAVAASTIVGLIVFPLSGFRAMFHDLGSADDLPLLTRIVLFPGASVALAIPALIAFVVAFLGRQPLARRRTWIVAAFGLGLLGMALCLVAMYLPIFSLAGRIKAD